MLYRRGEGVALRLSCNAYRLGRAAAACISLLLAAGLPACTADPSWPALGKVTDLGNVLTPEERQKAVQDMQKSQTQNSSATGTPAKQGQ